MNDRVTRFPLFNLYNKMDVSISSDRVVINACVLAVACGFAAFIAPSLVISSDASLTTRHGDVLAFVAQVQLVLANILWALCPPFVAEKVIIGAVAGTLYLIGATIVFHIFFVLFGAPLWTQIVDTLLFSFCVAALGAFPIGCVYGFDTAASIRLLIHWNISSPLDAVLLTGFLSPLIGAWIGSFAIPLDWDRPWQIWPISCAYVALAGYSVAMLTCAATLWLGWPWQKLKAN